MRKDDYPTQEQRTTQKNKLRSPLRPVVATQNNVRVLEHLCPPVLRYLYLALRALGWPTP